MRAAVLACALLLAAPAAASAEWQITPMIGVTFAGKTTITDPDQGTSNRHPALAGSVALLSGGVLGVEGVVSLTPRFFENRDMRTLLTPSGQSPIVDSSYAFAMMGNVVVAAPQKWTEYFLRPFVSGGFGLLRVSKVEGADLLSTNLNLFAYNVGGGAVGFLTRHTGVRFDVRYYSTVTGTYHGPIALGDGDVHVRYMTASLGVVIRPGRPR
ncbi:MAG TPA: outer membrane beta-barrel protein [Vicinamibacterales bacterium]|nr:outer membrane beta-barrel protein [Vicinamibacterales bacterium]